MRSCYLIDTLYIHITHVIILDEYLEGIKGEASSSGDDAETRSRVECFQTFKITRLYRNQLELGDPDWPDLNLN